METYPCMSKHRLGFIRLCTDAVTALRRLLLLCLLVGSTFTGAAAPLFMTHHAPMGGWCSLTFGLPGGGVGIEQEALAVQDSGDLLVACARGGETIALPFFTTDTASDYEGSVAGNAPPKAFRTWKVVPETKLERRLTPSTDEYSGEGLRLRVTSPRVWHWSPGDSDQFTLGMLPALVLELEIDNTAYGIPATGFLGLAYKGVGRIEPADWSMDGLSGVIWRDRWGLLAAHDGGVETLRAGSVARLVESGTKTVHPGGNEGGLLFTVPPHSRRSFTAVFAFCRPGERVTPGIPTTYAHAAAFGSVEGVARYAIANVDRIRRAAAVYDETLAKVVGDPTVMEMLAQASQGYYANTSLLREASGAWRWSVCEGQFAWRNTLDLAADHLPFELAVHPWVVGNVIDSFIDRYSYRDRVHFAGEAGGGHPGGLSFPHDQGNYVAYAPSGRSAYEQPDREGVYSYMTTEQLLNGVYCAAAYALRGGDPAWRTRRLPVARELLQSIENREGRAPGGCNGILTAQSDRVGTGKEITTYDALDQALQNSAGNLYIVVKSWCAAVLLERWFLAEKDQDSAARCAALAARVTSALEHHFNEQRQAFPANLVEGGDAYVMAALDPLVVPLSCGLGSELGRYSAVLGLLRRHARSCLQAGRCLDAVSGGLRLSSSSANTWPSKVALTLAALGWLEGRLPTQAAPSAYARLREWMQVSARRVTVSDQINATDGRTIGGSYYPRLVTVISLSSSTSTPAVESGPR